MQHAQQAALVDEYVGRHIAEANTLRTLRARLRYATDKFGETRIDRLDAEQIGAWRKSLPRRSVWARSTAPGARSTRS